MVGHRPLEASIGVRVPVPQPALTIGIKSISFKVASLGDGAFGSLVIQELGVAMAS